MRASHILLAVAVAAVWGFNFVAIKVGLRDFPPLLFSCLRFALAALPVLVLGWRKGPPVPWRFVIGIGVMLGVVKFPLLYLGIDAGMPAGLASLVLQSQAFFTAIFAAFLLGDRPGPRQIGGMVVAFAGVGLIALEMPAGDSLLGLGLTLAAAAAWGVANIVMKRAKAPDLFSLMVWVSLVPPLPVLALSLALEGPDRIVHAFATLTVVGVGSLLYIAAAATLFGFAAWGFLMRHYPASLVAPFSLLVPIFGMSSSALLLGETFTAAKLAGGLLVFAGLALSVLKLPAPARVRI
ncbi:EamA family transporter [Azospirillum sp. YIM B02556]|uniref:EamA family transporter n=1 Tax=Azospirillum endophyticum TaxID=2800326 RepID=A0ABS1EZB8_9PROT|nr:EamA family transporter [Azospirillum endophyticum]MBK1836505.1 EamA family transporter [Azospirillum endophyticum]